MREDNQFFLDTMQGLKEAIAYERGALEAERVDEHTIIVNNSQLSIKDFKVIPLKASEEYYSDIERMRDMPITPDEDCPELTPEQALSMRCVNPME